MTMTRKALVVGLGIAGMAAAKSLSEIGWDVTVVERSPARRRGGYFIALFPTGIKSAERMGILDALPGRVKPGSKTWEVNRSGRRTPGMSIASLPNGIRMLLRGDVEEALFNTLPSNVEIRFATVPIKIYQDKDGVDVTLRTTVDSTEISETYDLVLGADGLRSTVRRLVFGPDENFVHNMNYMIAATLLEKDISGFTPGDGIAISEPGRSATIFAFKDRTPSLLFSYRTDDPIAELKKKPIDALREAFGSEPTGGALGEMLDQYAAAERPLFDIAQQVRMRRWYNGRVALIGDAAWCMTLYSGLGASAGIAGGELLGGLLKLYNNDVAAALAEWNERMYSFVTYQHQTIDQSRLIFVTADRSEYNKRKLMMRFMAMPGVGNILAKKTRSSKSMKMKAVDVGSVTHSPE